MKRLLLTVLFAALSFGAAFAQTVAVNPPQVAEDMRQALFSAQVALMGGDLKQAADALREAQASYTLIRPTIAEAAPDTASRIDTGFGGLQDALNHGDVTDFAAGRGAVWSGVLGGSAQVIFSAVENGDGQQAALWLPLRDFRASTKFSRPDADSTLAIRALIEGKSDSATVLESVKADLLDTYQAQLTAALTAADEASMHGFTLRRAEEIGLASGYFAILGEAYARQRGGDSFATAQTVFDKAFSAVLTADDGAFAAARAQMDNTLVGFRAAPLSEEELARRAGQLIRFSSLVPVEYERGVRNGQVVNDIEIQEAITFHAGAQAALLDLNATFTATNPDQAAQLGALFATLIDQIRAVADPAEVRATAAQIDEVARTLIPAAWLQGGADSDIDVITSVLDQIRAAVAGGDYAAAESARLEAYALLELGLEQRLQGFAPDLAVTIESLFWQGTPEYAGLATLLADRAPLSVINAGIGRLETALKTAQTVLKAEAAPGAVIGNAAVIVFREGLEAVLILASLLASLRTAEELRYRRPLVAGAGLAFVATAITWVLAHGLLQVFLPLGERLEAIVSLIAIGVLLIITNWFFHKVYWTGWMANFHSRKRKLIGGVITISLSQTIGLVLLGFTSIYREGFETVLFLQSLVLEAGTSVVLQGVLLGLIGTAIVGVITFALQVRLPYKKMLVVTGVMIGGVLLVMVGHTVHVMQAVGWMPITPIQGVYLPYWMGQWFGLFATWQGIVLQVASATFVIGSYFLAERQQKQHRQRRSAPAAA